MHEKKGYIMPNHTITYSYEQVYHIQLILQRNLCTIEGLIKVIQSCGHTWSMDDILKTTRDEIATCIRIIETEGIHV